MRGETEPVLTSRDEGGRRLPELSWRFEPPVRAISSAPLGGGIGGRSWVINASVPAAYSRSDPQVHLAELADELDLRGPGVGMLTAVDVGSAATGCDGGVVAWATVGVGHPTWAAAPDGEFRRYVGTINIVAWVPVPFTDAALVNAVATVTEAKAQALWESEIDATGTASDAVCLLCPQPGDGSEPAESFAGPRSVWGARLARATHAAVMQGIRVWRASRRAASGDPIE